MFGLRFTAVVCPERTGNVADEWNTRLFLLYEANISTCHVGVIKRDLTSSIEAQQVLTF